MNESTRKKLLYLLRFMDCFIEQSIYDVLLDSVEDPHYSAVTTSNLIKCYLDVMRDLGEEIDACSLTDYMIDKCFSPEEIDTFFKKQKCESDYYVGEQY